MGKSDDEETSVAELSLLFIVEAGELLRDTLNASELFGITELSLILKINTHEVTFYS
jgi:hypothetical protein